MISIETNAKIRGGCSGGPILNSAGEIVGVVSHIGGTVDANDSEGYEGTGHGAVPIAHQALPTWIWARILAKAQLKKGGAK